MGRHGGSQPDQGVPVPARTWRDEPVAQEIEFATVPWRQERHPSSSAPAWVPPLRAMPPVQPASGQRQRTGPVPVPIAAPGPARGVLPPEHRPVRAMGTPATDAIPATLPSLGAPSLSTGPITVTPTPDRRTARRIRIGLALAAVAVAVSVGAQVVALRTAAEPPSGAGGAATSHLPTGRVDDPGSVTGRP